MADSEDAFDEGRGMSREERRMLAAMESSEDEEWSAEEDVADEDAPPPRRRRAAPGGGGRGGGDSGGSDESGGGSSDDDEEGGSEDDGEEGLSEDYGGEGTSDEDEEAQEQLKDVSFEERERMRRDGTTTAADRIRKERRLARAAEEAAKNKRVARANKNRPQEVSSKKPPPRMTEVVPRKRRDIRDPRFESLSGRYDEDTFRQRYRFVYDEILPQEKAALLTKAKREKREGRRKELQTELNRLESQIQLEKGRRQKRKREAGLRRAQREAVASGKQPYFLKSSEKRKLELVEKFKELKKSGKLDRFLEKKRKKNASKDRAHMPTVRRGTGKGEA